MNPAPHVTLTLERFDARVGGLEKWTEQLAAFLVERGHEVHVVCFGAVTALPVRAHVLAWSPWPLERAARVASAVGALGPTLVHDTGTAAAADVFQPLSGARTANLERDLAGRTWFARLRFALSPRSRRWRREIEELERRQLANARRVVAVSRLVRDDLVRRYFVDGRTLELIPNGVDLARFRPGDDASARSATRGRLGLGPETLFLLMAHNFHLKGVDTALRALRRLRDTGAPAHLAIAGKDAAAPFMALARRLGVERAATFLGSGEPVESLYRAADVLVQPTRHDACSLATLEALASGLPVITTRLNGAVDLFEPGRHGLVLDDPADSGALAQAMADLLAPDVRARMAADFLPLRPRLDVRSGFARLEELFGQVRQERVERP